jgi:hypothetical protein
MREDGRCGRPSGYEHLRGIVCEPGDETHQRLAALAVVCSGTYILDKYNG